MESASNAWTSTVASASPWAVDAALIIVSIAIAVAVIGALAVAVGMKIRDLSGAGATPSQIQHLLDKKINGGLERIEEGLEALAGEVRANRNVADQRHAENQHKIGRIEGIVEGLDVLNDMAGGGRHGRAGRPR